MLQKEYRGVLIHPGLPSGRCSGIITIDRFSVTFSCEEQVYSIALAELHIAAGGAGNRLIFFTDGRSSDISVYTDDREVLKDPALANNERLKGALHQTSKTLRKLLVSSAIVLGVFAIVVVGLYLFKNQIVKGVATQVPAEWEQKAGDKLFTSLTVTKEILKRDSLYNVFVKVSKPLVQEVEKEGFKIDLYLVKDPTVNAFALPGGKVVIQTGLIESAKSWEEVLGVLSHELAHVSQRHHLRGIINNVGLFAILSAAFGDVSALAGTIANMGGELASLANSRTFEREADSKGWDYLVGAGVNPNGMISFFETLQKQHGELEKLPLAIVSTHPDTKSRIEALKKKQKREKSKFTPIKEDFAKFREELLKK
jgi:predicted Zn-dependent protease